ncbi:MAG: hypothetical protein KC482_08835 [Dehalococcoidia bacterium]|nr:hypothetical protein [Dehalococcoidia bacterium]
MLPSTTIAATPTMFRAAFYFSNPECFTPHVGDQRAIGRERRGTAELDISETGIDEGTRVLGALFCARRARR